MKTKHLSIGLLLVGMALLFSFTFFKKNLPNSGKITYDLIINGNEKTEKFNVDYYYENEKSCTEFVNENFYAKTINDLKDSIAQFLINVGGIDFAIKTKWNLKSDIRYVDESRKIKGFNCKKAIAKTNFEDLKEVEVWYIENSNFQGGIYGGIPGLNHVIAEMKIKSEADTITCTMKEVNNKFNKEVFNLDTDNTAISIDLVKFKDLFSDLNIELGDGKE